jgi:hypothetical protein
MDYNAKLEAAKQYLRDRKKLISEQNPEDPKRFCPSLAVDTNIRTTFDEYRATLAAKKSQTSTQTVRFFDRKVRTG